jgi:tRNA dimethylallyltransferase
LTQEPERRGVAETPLALLIAGPTASGKSALALVLAERLGGTVINADSMQIYRELRVLTARPSPEDEARVPHALYGVRPAALPGDVAWWRGAALWAMAEARGAGRLPIICGGSGLYFSALLQGLADIPAIDPAIRSQARAMLAEIGPAALHARLTIKDPQTAARLIPNDGQRIARAYEVLLATGRGLAAWQASPALASPDWRFAAIQLDPPREELQAAIALRFGKMVEAGALAEVEALMGQALDPALPAMRALGVPELAAHLRGELPIVEAVQRAVTNSNRYVKRQSTWFRHHPLAEIQDTVMIDARIGSIAQLSERRMADLTRFIVERR